MNERERRVAAEDHTSFAPQTVVERGSETFDPYDRGYAKRNAEKKDLQASESPRKSRMAKRAIGVRPRVSGKAAGALIR